MKFTTEATDQEVTIYSPYGRKIATFALDYLEQVDTVVIYQYQTTPEERLAALRLGCWHVRKYFVQRHTSPFGGLMQGRHTRDEVSRERSLSFFEESEVPEDIPADYDQLVAALKSFNIPVIEAVYKDLVFAVGAVVSDSSLKGLVGITAASRQLNDFRIRFSTTHQDAQFRFWHSMSEPSPGRGGDLHVVPSYHPVMQGRQYTHLVNGDTDSLIRGDSVHYVYAPTDGEPSERGGMLMSSWAHPSHPVRAEGTSFEAVINPYHILSEEGAATLLSLLTDALELGRGYVAISGGFRSMYTYPSNVVRKYGIRLEQDRVRGSEGHCAWTYHTLQAEGQLDNSYVPAWFLREGWLKAYPALEENSVR